MPNVGGLVISNLNATSTMPLRHSNIMHSRHRLDSRFFLLQAIRTENPEMNLSIDRGGIFENRWPVNIPICEDCPRVGRGGDKTGWSLRAREFRNGRRLTFRARDARLTGTV